MARFFTIKTLAGECVLLNVDHVIVVSQGEKGRANFRTTPAANFPGTIYSQQSFRSVAMFLATIDDLIVDFNEEVPL